MDEALGRDDREEVAYQVRLHEGDGDHVHELSIDARGRIAEHIWKVENVALTTVGIDIGSSTSHLMFAGVRLQRKTQALSSRFVVVERKVLWKSPILFTPFLPDGRIDAGALERFLRSCHADAGLAPDAIDTGAVILTGEAIKRVNARAIADVFAADAGRFVCASAGHHLECALAAHGSGAVAMSRDGPRTILNVDIGGGTTKLALAHAGEILSTAAFAVGARVEGDADAFADAAIAWIRGEPDDYARSLLVTEPFVRLRDPDAIVFSGGVAEYIYRRETRDFADKARAIAERIRAACDGGRIAPQLLEPAERIRATVIGASQFTVQVSGKTIHVTDPSVLPLHNVPVVAPRLQLGEHVDAKMVAQAVLDAMERSADTDGALALSLHWTGDPEYSRIRALAEGIALALPPPASHLIPLVLLTNADIARTLGHILTHELALGRGVVSIDGIELREFDFVDIGTVLQPANVVPVVVKSLLFAATPQHPRRKTQ
jgi:ethanolamine utilization protein EutA